SSSPTPSRRLTSPVGRARRRRSRSWKCPPEECLLRLRRARPLHRDRRDHRRPYRQRPRQTRRPAERRCPRERVPVSLRRRAKARERIAIVPAVVVDMRANDAQHGLNRRIDRASFGEQVVLEGTRGPNARQILEYQDSYAEERALVLHARKSRKPPDIPLDAVTAPQSATYFFCTLRSVKFSVGKTYSVLRQVIQHHSTAVDFAISASKIEGEAHRVARNLRVSR